jgi:Fe-S oxidoreductase
MQIRDPIATTDNCRYCLMCRHVAPVELVTYREALSPHGIALLIASVRRGLIDWNEETVDTLYGAADGGNSRAHCVTDQPLPEAIAAARAEVVEQEKAPAVVYELDEALRRWGTPFTRQSPKEVVGHGQGASDAALFVGDEAQYLRPEALEAALALLRAVGVAPILIGRGRGNGFLASSLGLTETARRLAEANIGELRASRAESMLVLSPGDYFTFRQLYDERLGVEWPADVTLMEVTTLLADRLLEGRLTFRVADAETPYAYVDPTHAVRVPGRHDAPRALAAAVLGGPAQELMWRRERAHPAGNTALQFTQPTIAARLTRARLQDGADCGAQLLLCEDPGTLAQLDQHAEAAGMRVVGLYELLAENLL